MAGTCPYDGKVKDELLKKFTFNEFLHTENAPVSMKDLGSVEQQKKYIYNAFGLEQPAGGAPAYRRGYRRNGPRLPQKRVGVTELSRDHETRLLNPLLFILGFDIIFPVVNIQEHKFDMKRLLFAISALAAANLFGDAGAVRARLAKRTLPDAAKMSSSDAIFAEFEAADKACDEAWRECKTKDEFFARSKRVREDFIKAVGGFPEERCPLNAKTVATVKRDGYIVEKVYFESWPNVHVTANLFIPDDPKYKAPYPAVLVTCGHSNNGKGSDAYQRGCVLAAKAGLACLIYDPYDQGERGQGKHRANVNAHNRAGALAALLGGSMARYRMWDGMRAIDYLESRPEVDASRIGVMGNSGGGTMTSLLMAVDPRLKAACPSCFISTLTANAKNIAPGDAEQNTFAQLAIGANHASFALMQPERPVRFQFCHGDFFPFYGSLSTFKLVKEVASKFGLGERYEMTDVDGPHGWKESTRTSSVEWMRRWLYGDKDAFKHDLDGYRKLDKTFNPKKSDMGVCNGGEIVCPKGKVLNLPGERTIYDLIRDEYAATESARKERVSPETVACLAGISTEKIGTRGVWREVSCVEADGFKERPRSACRLFPSPQSREGHDAATHRRERTEDAA